MRNAITIKTMNRKPIEYIAANEDKQGNINKAH